MRISFVGSGRVATHLANALFKHHQIVQVLSRNLSNAERLAKQVQAQAIDQFGQLNGQIDLLIIAVQDQSIVSVMEQLPKVLQEVLVVHTSGSTALNTLKAYQNRVGVFYPLQTFSFDRAVNWNSTPILIEANEKSDQQQLHELADQLSQCIYLYSSEQRLSLHLAAVFACNFSNACYDMAQQIVNQYQVDFSLLYPLIIETANKATQHDPKTMQTGPAVRNDQHILALHQSMLNTAHQPDLGQIYHLLSQFIMQRHADR